MRLFIGCFVRLKGYGALKRRFDPSLDGRWVRDGSLHLTFRFLGEMKDASGIVAALEELEYPRLTPIRFDGLGRFGHKILYATCDNPVLAQTAAAIDARLGPRSKREKSFIPHVTLMRIRSLKTDRIEIPDRLPEGVEIDGELRVQLIQSEQGYRGTFYKVLRGF
jgi:2'-5' RNA ligase